MNRICSGNTQNIVGEPVTIMSRIIYNICDMKGDIADTATIRQSLQRLFQTGVLRRIIKGVYEKPKFSQLLDEYVAADQ